MSLAAILLITALLLAFPEADSLALPNRTVGINLTAKEVSKENLKLSLDCGFGTVRIPAFANDFQRSGSENFRKLDEIVTAVTSVGAEPVVVLLPRRDDPAEFRRFAENILTSLKGKVRYYQIFNNINYSSHIPLPRFISLLDEVYKLAKEKDPENKIILGGVRGLDYYFINQLMETPAKNSFDILALNLFPPLIEPEKPLGFESPISNSLVDYPRFLSVLNVVDKPIWVTELGYPTGYFNFGLDQSHQAMYILRSVLMLLKFGVERVILYKLADDSFDFSNPEANFGIVLVNSGKKASYSVLQNLNQLMAGLEAEEAFVPVSVFNQFPAKDHPVYFVVFKNERNYVFLYWTSVYSLGERKTEFVFVSLDFRGESVMDIQKNEREAVAYDVGMNFIKIGDLPLSHFPNALILKRIAL